MSIIKRQPKQSVKDLVDSIYKFAVLLEGQKEHEAVDALKSAAKKIDSEDIQSSGFQSAIKEVIDSYEGEHELSAYLLKNPGEDWTEATQLSQAGSRVLNLANRFFKTFK